MPRRARPATLGSISPMTQFRLRRRGRADRRQIPMLVLTVDYLRRRRGLRRRCSADCLRHRPPSVSLRRRGYLQAKLILQHRSSARSNSKGAKKAILRDCQQFHQVVYQNLISSSSIGTFARGTLAIAIFRFGTLGFGACYTRNFWTWNFFSLLELWD